MIERIFFTLLLIVIGPQAVAQTSLPCLPKQWGSTGSDYMRGSVDGYGWLGWTCTVSGAPKVYGFVWEPNYVLKHPDASGSTPNQLFRAYYALNVDECTSAGCNTARAAMHEALK